MDVIVPAPRPNHNELLQQHYSGDAGHVSADTAERDAYEQHTETGAQTFKQEFATAEQAV